MDSHRSGQQRDFHPPWRDCETAIARHAATASTAIENLKNALRPYGQDPRVQDDIWYLIGTADAAARTLHHIQQATPRIAEHLTPRL